MGEDGVKLFLNHFDGFVGFTLGQCLSEAEDDLHSCFHGVFNLFGDSFIVVSEMGPSFGVSDDNPADVDILELLCGDFSGVGTVSELGAVLGCDFDVLVLFGEHGGH